MERTYLAVFAQSPEGIVELLGAMDTLNRVEITSTQDHSLIPPERVEKWASARVEDQLIRFWVSQMDGFSTAAIRAVVDTLEGLGLLTHNHAAAWFTRMNGCPLEAGVVDENSARKWCAYCGDLTPATGPGAMDSPGPEWTEPLVMPEPEPQAEPAEWLDRPEPMPEPEESEPRRRRGLHG